MIAPAFSAAIRRFGIGGSPLADQTWLAPVSPDTGFERGILFRLPGSFNSRPSYPPFGVFDTSGKTDRASSAYGRRFAAKASCVAMRLLAPLVAALVFASAASAAPPVPRLVYTKAVAYVTAQAKAHHMKVTCDPYTADGLTGRWACTFGAKYQLRMRGGQDCQLQADLYVGPAFVLYTAAQPTTITLCHPGWQKTLPTPWAH